MYQPLNDKAKLVFEAMVEAGWASEVSITPAVHVTPTYVTTTIPDEPRTVSSSFGNPYKGNGLPIETNMKRIAMEFIGICEDQKDFKKELSAAVKLYGHDELLDGFYDWAQIQSGKFLGKRPISSFLKNGTWAAKKPVAAVTNPLLDEVEKFIALTTNNLVFFSGEYRLNLAKLLKEHGLLIVKAAFTEFWGTVTDRDIPWAHSSFLKRADLIIHTLKVREETYKRQVAETQEALKLAQQAAQEEEVEEEHQL